ncbi:MAG: hypothetical protein KA184_22270 [Candidatus Hydrogenedentes bacterium]|nr:hypothetical protein [Candidatus Hydrogenedentota bacterium]
MTLIPPRGAADALTDDAGDIPAFIRAAHIPVLVSNYDPSLGLTDLLEEFFREAGLLRVYRADSWQELLAVAQAHRPWVIVRDFHYWEMRGDELTRRIRALPGMANVPQILFPPRGLGFERTDPLLIESPELGVMDLARWVRYELLPEILVTENNIP